MRQGYYSPPYHFTTQWVTIQQREKKKPRRKTTKPLPAMQSALGWEGERTHRKRRARIALLKLCRMCLDEHDVHPHTASEVRRPFVLLRNWRLAAYPSPEHMPRYAHAQPQRVFGGGPDRVRNRLHTSRLAVVIRCQRDLVRDLARTHGVHRRHGLAREVDKASLVACDTHSDAQTN